MFNFLLEKLDGNLKSMFYVILQMSGGAVHISSNAFPKHQYQNVSSTLCVLYGGLGCEIRQPRKAHKLRNRRGLVFPTRSKLSGFKQSEHLLQPDCELFLLLPPREIPGSQ